MPCRDGVGHSFQGYRHALFCQKSRFLWNYLEIFRCYRGNQKFMGRIKNVGHVQKLGTIWMQTLFGLQPVILDQRIRWLCFIHWGASWNWRLHCSTCRQVRYQTRPGDLFCCLTVLDRCVPSSTVRRIRVLLHRSFLVPLAPLLWWAVLPRLYRLLVGCPPKLVARWRWLLCDGRRPWTRSGRWGQRVGYWCWLWPRLLCRCVLLPFGKGALWLVILLTEQRGRRHRQECVESGRCQRRRWRRRIRKRWEGHSNSVE